jgi:hypothetical protein
MPYYPLQSSFSAGEVSPRVFAQEGTPVYDRGLEVMRNFIALSQGPAKRRPAFRFIADILPVDPTSTARVIPFDINENISFILVLTHLRMDIYNLNGPAVDNNLVKNGDFFERLAAWIVDTSNAGVVRYNPEDRGAELNATAQGGSTAAIEQSLGVLTTGNHTFSGKFVNKDPGSGALCRIMLGTAQGLADIVDVQTDSNPQLVITPIALTAPGPVWLRIEMTAGSGHFVVDNLQVLDLAGSGPILGLVTPWTEREIGEIQYALPPNEETIFLVQQNHDPYELVLDLLTSTFTFQTIPLSDPPTEWTGSNFPGVVAFFQGRSWFARTPNEPGSIWGSVSSQYRNFLQGPNPADSIEWELNQRGAIQWMQGVREFLVATENQENIFTSQQGILKTGDVEVTQQSAFGSAFLQAQEIGDQVLYITADRTKLRAEQQSFIEQGWIAQDLTFPSEHILKGFGQRATRIAFARDPEQVIWISREDGTLAASTYERSLEIVGWHQHEIGETGPVVSATEDEPFTRRQFPAQVLDIAPINFQGIDLVVAVTRRIIDGDPKIYLEEMDLTMDIYQESWVEYTLPTLTNVVTGLDHLEGETVQVLVDDAVDPDNVVSGGSITTQAEGYNFKIGLRAPCFMKTLSKQGGNQAGTGQGTLRRNIEVFARLLGSTRPFLNGVRPPDRTPSSPMNLSEPLKTGDFKVMDLGYDLFGQVEVFEDIPKDVQVLGLFGKVDINHV